MDFKFLHAADLHLDSPLRGLSQYEGVPADVVRTATRAALDNLVTCAIEEQVAFVIIAGDLYDGDWEAFATGLYFCSAMRRLHEVGIDVFLVYGNHDAESHLTKQLPLPPNVKVFSAAKAQSFEHLGTGTVLHGQSYKSRDPGGNLAANYPSARGGAFNIGVLHTALTGAQGHQPYAPCHPDELSSKGYHYWALGHVHTFQTVREDPPIVFPGNLQGRNIRETGPKGAVLISVADRRVTEIAHRALDVVRWSRVDVDVAGAEDDRAVHERTRKALATALANEADGRPLMVRVRFRGESALHGSMLQEKNAWREGVRAIATALSDELWLEKLEVAVTPPSIGGELAGDFEALLETLARDPELEKLVAADLSDFLTKAPAELDEELELLAGARIGAVGSVLQEASASLRARLMGEA